MKKTTLHVQGMHCPSCEILIKDKFSELTNVKAIKANHTTQKVEVEYMGHLDKDLLNQKINQFGYKIVEKADLIANQEPLAKRLFDVGAITAIILILYFFASELKILPDFNPIGNLGFLSVFVLGLIASTSTCMATSGSLFMATVGKLQNSVIPSEAKYSLVPGEAEGSRSNERFSHTREIPRYTRNDSWVNGIIPSISFNLGRVLSYGFFGFIFGYFGKTLVTKFQFGPILTLVVSVLMIIVALDMLKIFSIYSILPTSLTSDLFRKLENRLIKNPKKTAFFLGAITYLLPCGFTQTVQLYALGTADPIKSALIMMVFAIGTVPALMAIGFASSFTKSAYYPMFTKVIGVLILIIGTVYFTNFLSIYGVNLSSSGAGVAGVNVTEKDGTQTVKMDVNSNGYTPNRFTVKKDVPVKWLINGVNVFGCQGYLVVPKLNISRALEAGENVIEFTPAETGTLGFSCGMGMYRGRFEVI